MQQMKKTLHTFLLTLALSCTFVLSAPVHAQEPAPQTSHELPLPPTSTQPAAQLDFSQPQALSLPPLKAVLLVGPIDGDTGPATTAEVADMRQAAQVLRNNAVLVIEFYPPNGDWEQIKAAANGAHFFLYRGHGIYSGDIQHPTQVGGISVGGVIYSNDVIRADLHLAQNAIVMIYGCYASGSSGDDRFSISSSEAQARVVEYSDPFFDIGAAGYYSNWFGNAYAEILGYLFQGQTLGNAFKSFSDYDPAQVEQYALLNHPGNVLWMDKDHWPSPYPVPAPQYAHTFAGQESSTLTSLFAQELRLSRTSVAIMTKPGYAAINQTVQVTSNPIKTFTWSSALSIQQGGTGWVSLSSTSGTSQSGFTIQIASGKPLGTYRATVQVTGSDPTLLRNPQTVNVELIVVPQVFKVFLPNLSR